MKHFIFVFTIGTNLEWSGDKPGALIDRGVNPDERAKIRDWMEAAQPGSFLKCIGGMAVCSGDDGKEDGVPKQILLNIEDGNHKSTAKSIAFFRGNRKLVSPVNSVEIIWDGNGDFKTVVTAQEGSTMSLSGFAIDGNGDACEGLGWLLNYLGIRFHEDTILKANPDAAGSFAWLTPRMTADAIEIYPDNYSLEAGRWRGIVNIQRIRGTILIRSYPDPSGQSFFDDPGELCEAILNDCKLLGVEWSADPRIQIAQAADPREHDAVRINCSERIGWNYE